MNLSSIKTCDLVAELQKREGVEAKIAPPYETLEVSVQGAAIVLIVTD